MQFARLKSIRAILFYSRQHTNLLMSKLLVLLVIGWSLIVLVDHAIIIHRLGKVVAELKKLTRHTDDIQK